MKMRGRGSTMKEALIMALLVFSTAAMARDSRIDGKVSDKPAVVEDTSSYTVGPRDLAMFGAGLIGMGIYARIKNRSKT
jgi:hypothetical protein